MSRPTRHCFKCGLFLTKGTTWYFVHNGEFVWACPAHYERLERVSHNDARACRVCKETKPITAEYFSDMPEGTKPTGTNRVNLMFICKGCENIRGVI